MLLPEYGHYSALLPDGTAVVWRPTLARTALLGTPAEVVALFAALHGPRALESARYVLHAYCDDDASPAVGWHGLDGEYHPGAMDDTRIITIARALMQHGVCGTARPGSASSGGYSQTFDAGEHISAACVHLGMSLSEAGDLTMTQLQSLFAAKYPDQSKASVPTEAEYDATMKLIMEKRAKAGIK